MSIKTNEEMYVVITRKLSFFIKINFGSAFFIASFLSTGMLSLLLRQGKRIASLLWNEN